MTSSSEQPLEQPTEQPAEPTKVTRREAREKARTDPFYLSHLLGYDFQPDVHTDLFRTLLQPRPGLPIRDLSPIKNILILWPRGHFKTSAVALCCVQLILNFPDIRILVMEGSLKLTKGVVKEIKSHFNGQNPKSRLPELFPEFCSQKMGDAWGFTVPARSRKHLKDGTVTAASVKAISTGSHFDVFFADDLVNQSNYKNVELLDELEKAFNLFIPLIDPGGYTIVTGTRYHHGDLYGRILRKNTGAWSSSVRDCWGAPDGPGLLFPERETADGRKIGFTKEILEAIRSDDGTMFAAQYENRIVSGKQERFTEALILASVRNQNHPEFPHYAPRAMFVDLAESDKADSDDSAIAIGRIDVQSRPWIEEMYGDKWTTATLANQIIAHALKWQPRKIVFQKAPGVVYFTSFLHLIGLQKGLRLPIEVFNTPSVKNAKYIRIGALEKDFRNQKIFLMSGISAWEKILEQLVQFPKSSHDDYPDVLGLLVEYLRQSVPLRPIVQGPSALQRAILSGVDDIPERRSPLGSVLVC